LRVAKRKKQNAIAYSFIFSFYREPKATRALIRHKCYRALSMPLSEYQNIRIKGILGQSSERSVAADGPGFPINNMGVKSKTVKSL